MVKDEASKRIGRTVGGKYRIERLLGVGGMAAVYVAQHRNKRRVAIKMLHAAVSLNDELRARFLREGYVANTVEHPGVVAVLDDDVSEDGAAFLVLELLEGETLEKRAEAAGGRLPTREILGYADQLLGVLEAAHRAGVIHRDIKPDNVFITDAGTLKVLDFGIARLRDSATGPTTTVTGVALGTPAFMSPEQARGRMGELDARSDLYSVAAMMFTLATGKFVHEADTVNEMVASTIYKQARSILSVFPVPDAFAKIVDKGLRLAPEERWEDAAQMRGAVKAAIEEVAAAPPDTPDAGAEGNRNREGEATLAGPGDGAASETAVPVAQCLSAQQGAAQGLSAQQGIAARAAQSAEGSVASLHVEPNTVSSLASSSVTEVGLAETVQHPSDKKTLVSKQAPAPKRPRAWVWAAGAAATIAVGGVALATTLGRGPEPKRAEVSASVSSEPTPSVARDQPEVRVDPSIEPSAPVSASQVSVTTATASAGARPSVRAPTAAPRSSVRSIASGEPPAPPAPSHKRIDLDQQK